MKKQPYSKIKYHGNVYFIQEHLFLDMNAKGEYPGHLDLRLLQYADFVIKTETNELVKCRYDLEEAFDVVCSCSSESHIIEQLREKDEFNFRRNQALHERIYELEDEREALADAIYRAAVKLNICREDVCLTGPQLIMLCADMGDMK